MTLRNITDNRAALGLGEQLMIRSDLLNYFKLMYKMLGVRLCTIRVARPHKLYL